MLLERRQFLVKEHVAMFKLTDTYDIFDPETGEQIGLAKETVPGWAKMLRLVIHKRLMPTTVEIREREDGPAVLAIRRGVGLFRTPVQVSVQGQLIGSFKSKVFTLGGGFWVYDTAGHQIAEVTGDWKGWDFRFTTADGRELGRVTKKWAGLAKELFTSADNYLITITEESDAVAALLLAAGIAIDTVYKEKR